MSNENERDDLRHLLAEKIDEPYPDCGSAGTASPAEAGVPRDLRMWIDEATRVFNVSALPSDGR